MQYQSHGYSNPFNGNTIGMFNVEGASTEPILFRTQKTLSELGLLRS